MKTWFEAKLKYLKVNEYGSEQRVTETFLLDAVSFTDAESRMISETQKMVKGGDFAVTDIKQSNVSEIFPYESGEWWWKAKINLVTIDEEAGKEKRINVYHLVMADDIGEAINRLNESLHYLIIPYEAVTINRTQIADIFPYNLDEKAAELQS